MDLGRFARGLLVLAVALSLAGCVTVAPTTSPTAPPTPNATASPPPTAPPTPPPTAPPTATPTATPTEPATLPPTAPPTDSPTAEPTESTTDTMLDPNLDARFGSPEIGSGFVPDPRSESVVAGGPIDVNYLGNGCTGFAEPNPDYEIHYGAGAQPLLRIYFVADNPGDDATLIINDAASQWNCSDDEFGTTNPSIDFSPPLGGWYDIWIGSYSPSEYISGTLYITELDTYHP